MANKPIRIGLKLAIAAVILAAVGVGLVVYLRPVANVVLVTRGKAIDAKPGSVVVQAERETDLKSEYGGRILRSVLAPGYSFKTGDFLVQLDTRELQLQIQKTQDDLEAQKKRIAVGSPLDSQIANAEDDLAIKEGQYKMGSISETDFNQAKRAVKQLEQRRDIEKIQDQQSLANLENQLSAEKLQLTSMTLTAPFAGKVAEVYANEDDIISPNQAIAHLITTKRLVLGKVSEEDFADIRVGQSAAVQFLTYGDKAYRATVTQILPTADPQTQRYVVYLKVDIPLEKLVPGITGEVSITVAERNNALIVPRRAVVGNSLYVVDNGRVELRHVKLGYTGLNVVEVLSGVKAGEQVIADQIDEFQPGEHVRVHVEKY